MLMFMPASLFLSVVSVALASTPWPQPVTMTATDGGATLRISPHGFKITAVERTDVDGGSAPPNANSLALTRGACPTA